MRRYRFVGFPLACCAAALAAQGLTARIALAQRPTGVVGAYVAPRDWTAPPHGFDLLHQKIAVSFDLHANLSEGMVSPVDVLVAYRTNPHWDLAPTGFRAGSRLFRVLRGELHPVHAWRKLPVVLGGGVTIDFLAPMR